MNDDKDEKYTEEILDLLPLYKKELSKYSNNSLENTIQKKIDIKQLGKKHLVGEVYGVIKKYFLKKQIN